MAKKKAKGSVAKTVPETKEQLSSSDAKKNQEPPKDSEADAPETTEVVDTEIQDEPVATTTEEEPVISEEEPSEPDVTTEEASDTKKSVAAKTHARARGFNKKTLQKHWAKILAVAAGSVALFAIIAAGALGQYYKNRAMPGVVVAGVGSGAKSSSEIKTQLENQLSELKFTFQYNEKKLEPTLEEIGYQADVEKTLENAHKAKREDGIFTRIAFWKKAEVPVVYTVNDTLLDQYLETKLPELAKAPQDAQLQFDAKQALFVITPQSEGQGADDAKLKKYIETNAYNLQPATFQVETAKKTPTITEEKLKPLVAPANDLITKRVVLTGLGYTYQAKPSEIAAWLTPTPKEDGSVELVVDTAKIQSYVDSISKRISNAPVDKKVLTDESSGNEVVIQSGRDGTELAGKSELAAAIADALNKKSGTTQTMNIQTAAHKTVNMSAYDKWIEVDLSEQRTTAYERTTPVKNFIIASGTKGHETVTGEFAIWLKVRKQTMQGGSRADGSYYSIPNVEWVSYFYKDYALHGAWWREKFGAPASHGCVNMTNADASWVYEWAPVGTKVIVHQ